MGVLLLVVGQFGRDPDFQNKNNIMANPYTYIYMMSPLSRKPLLFGLMLLFVDL